jgi:hypothetical protein
MSPKDTQLQQLTDSPRHMPEEPIVQGPAPKVPTTRAETCSVEAQLQLLQTAMKEERALRLSQAVQASIELSEMRRALQSASEEPPSDPDSEGWFLSHVVPPLLITIVLLTAAGLLLFHPDWQRALLYPWVQDPVATQQQAAGSSRETWSRMETVQGSARVGPPSTESLSEPATEKYELARLNGALDAIPVTALPTIMGSVNEWLWALGGAPCSVESAHGEVSLVITGQGQSHPLLTALSRCADAVEHFTGAEDSH